MDHKRLRELIRNLQTWRALFESEGLSSITGPDGVEYDLHDIEYIYSCRVMLSTRQSQAIELFLYRNIREQDVAEMMGVSQTNPVAIYATQGLKRLCKMIEDGEIPRYRDGNASVAMSQGG